MSDELRREGEERGTVASWVWAAAAVFGVLLSLVAGIVSYRYTTAQAEQRFADVVDYVATQSLSYDAFNSAYATKTSSALWRSPTRRRATWSATARPIALRWNNMPTSLM